MPDLTNQLLDAIELIADKKVAAARYDKTIQATIVSCVDAQAGKYKIKYQGNMFYAYSTDTSTTLNNGISVYVNVPESDFSKVKTIIGTVANQGNLSSSIITENQRYEEIGIDCIIDNIQKQPIKINKNDTLLLYSKDSFMHEAISEVLQEEFVLNANQGKAFLLSATFTTNFEDVIANKEYSLVLTCKYKNDNKDSNSNIVYTFSSKNMTGNPLMYSMPTIQTRYFRFTEELEEISKIEIVTSGFQPKDELLIKELKLIPCRYLDNNEITTRHLRIKRPWGSQFTDSKTNLIARAELVENGRIVTLDANKIRYLWFIEQPDATDYEDIVGTGWVFLNDTGSNPECTYQKTLFKQRFRNIKCVLLYQLNDIEENNSSATYIATSQFFNNYPEYADDYFFIEKSVSVDGPFEAATSHNFSSGGEQIYLKALPIEPKVTSEQEKRQYKVNWVYKNINGDYTAESMADPNSQDPNNIIYIEAAKLNNISREYIACYYDNTNFIGQQSFNIGFTSAENLDYDINIINGDITYMYNEYGLAPTAVATENKVIIKQLELSILDKKTSFLIFGEDIAKIAKDNITWYITANDKDRLVDFTDVITENGKPVTVNIGGVEYIQAQGATLAYTLKEKYNSRANSNNIKVKVIYNNTAIWGTTNIQCYKVGDPGAIRGSYFIDIAQVQQTDNGFEKINEQPYFNSFHYELNDDNNLIAPSLFLQARVWDGQEWLKDENLVVDWEILNELPQLYSDKERNSLNTLISSFVKHGTSICEFKPKYIENGASYLNDIVLFSSDFFPLAQLVRVKLTITLDNEKKYFYRTIPIAVVMEAKNTIYDDKEKNRHLQIVDNSGFKYVKFDSAGQNPIYDVNSPFEVGFIDEDKNLIQDQVNTYHAHWECINQAYTVIPQYVEYDGDEFLIEDLDLLRAKPQKEGDNSFQFTVSVNNYLNISDYILYYSGVICKITDNRISPISISEDGEINGGVKEETLAEQAEEDSIIAAYKEIQRLRTEYLTKQKAILKLIEDADEATKQLLNQKLEDLKTEYYGEPNGLIYKAVKTYNDMLSSSVENLIGYVYFPIDIYKSYLDNAVVNNWDGHMLDMGTDDGGNSYLMANMIGAGSKDEEDKFHGVLMGSIVSTHTDNPKNNRVQTGIMAYGEGQRTFFLNAEDGTAMFGTGENSCIKIEPGGKARIQGAGMTISFSANNPYIKFTSGNFSVDAEGCLTAKEVDIQGHINAGGWSEDGDDAEFRPPIGAELNIGPNKDENGNVKDIDFNLEARKHIGEIDNYNNVYDFVQINYDEIEFGRANFSKTPDDNGAYKSKLITGLKYYDGALTIKGSIEADSGTIGGWKITEDAIVSQNRELILYSDGHVIGLGGSSDEDTDFIDINNSTITWNSMSNKTNYNNQSDFDEWKQQWRNDKENKEGRQTKASISTENGCLSMSSSSAVNISGFTSASLSASGTSMGVYSNNTDRVFGMSISSSPTGVDNGMPETIATLAGVMSKVEDPSAINPPKEDTETPKDTKTSNNTNTDNKDKEPAEKDKVANTEKYMGFLALNSTYDDSITNMTSTEEHTYTGIHVLERNNVPDTYMIQYNTEPPPKDDTEEEDSNNLDTTNNQTKAKTTNTNIDSEPVYQEEGYYVKPVEQDKIRREFLIIEEAKDKKGNPYSPRKYKTVPVSLSEAIQFWYLHRNDPKTEHLGDIKDDKYGNLEFWVEYFTSRVKTEFETFVREKDNCVKSGKGKYSKTSKFKRTWMTYRPSDEGYLAPTTYAVVGIPPDTVVMEKVEKKAGPDNKDEKQGESYCIKEFYQQGVVLNNKIDDEEATKYGAPEGGGKLEYYINVDTKGQVYEIIFPNKKQMKLQGFDPILAPNCPYNKKKE